MPAPQGASCRIDAIISSPACGGDGGGGDRSAGRRFASVLRSAGSVMRSLMKLVAELEEDKIGLQMRVHELAAGKKAVEKQVREVRRALVDMACELDRSRAGHDRAGARETTRSAPGTWTSTRSRTTTPTGGASWPRPRPCSSWRRVGQGAVAHREAALIRAPPRCHAFATRGSGVRIGAVARHIGSAVPAVPVNAIAPSAGRHQARHDGRV